MNIIKENDYNCNNNPEIAEKFFFQTISSEEFKQESSSMFKMELHRYSDTVEMFVGHENSRAEYTSYASDNFIKNLYGK